MDTIDRAPRRNHDLTQPTDFPKACFDANPCGILVVDGAGTIVQSNPAMWRMLDLDADQLHGRKQSELPVPALRNLFEGDDLVHLNGPGVARERWLQRNRGGDDDRVVYFFEDVTELVRLMEQNEALRRQVDELTITDELTGLANRRAFNRALTAQVTRSRRYGNPLSLALIELVDHSRADGRPDDDGVLNASRFLRDRLRWVDVIARWDHNHLLVILPETGEEAASEVIQGICSGFADTWGPDLEMRSGLSSWRKGDNEKKLMDRAAADLNADATGQAASAAC